MTIDNDDACVEIWQGVMQNPPTVATGATEDYQAVATTAAGAQTCTYNYRLDTALARSITYDANTGAVAVLP